MSMYDKNHYNIVISLQLIKINEKKRKKIHTHKKIPSPHWMCLGGTTDSNHPPWPGTIVTTSMSYFMTWGPGKEQGTNKPPSRKNQKEIPCVLPTSQNPPHWNPFRAEECMCCQEGPGVRVIGQRQPRNYLHHHKTRDCEPHGRAVLLGSPYTLALCLGTPYQ